MKATEYISQMRLATTWDQRYMILVKAADDPDVGIPGYLAVRQELLHCRRKELNHVWP